MNLSAISYLLRWKYGLLRCGRSRLRQWLGRLVASHDTLAATSYRNILLFQYHAYLHHRTLLNRVSFFPILFFLVLRGKAWKRWWLHDLCMPKILPCTIVSWWCEYSLILPYFLFVSLLESLGRDAFKRRNIARLKPVYYVLRWWVLGRNSLDEVCFRTNKNSFSVTHIRDEALLDSGSQTTLLASDDRPTGIKEISRAFDAIGVKKPERDRFSLVFNSRVEISSSAHKLEHCRLLSKRSTNTLLVIFFLLVFHKTEVNKSCLIERCQFTSLCVTQQSKVLEEIMFLREWYRPRNRF